MTTRLILDVDTGSDDAVALFLAACHPELDLVGVTCVHGNVTLDHVISNTLKVLDYVGCKAPVHSGANRPLIRADFPIPRAVLRGAPKDDDDAGPLHQDELPFPAAGRSMAETRAVQFLIDSIMAPGGDQIVVVATGPLTNLALALGAEPALAGRIARLIVMGGARGWGNVTAAAEFNFWVDPEAAAAVFAAGIKDVLIVPLDATHSAPLDRAACDRLERCDTAAGIGTAMLVRHRIDHYHQDDPEHPSAPVHDALCVAALVCPEVITESIPATVHIETRGERTIGAMLADTRAWRNELQNARVALRADGEIFIDVLERAFRK